MSILLPQQVDAVQPTLDNETNLLDLAKAKFGDLTTAEKGLFIASSTGKQAVYNKTDEKDNDPANAKQ